MSELKSKAISGAKWELMRLLMIQPVNLLYGIILARFITPDEMGILGLTAIFFNLAAQLKDCGFSTALLRKLDRTELDNNTVFWTNFALNAIFSAILFFLAPFFAQFFNTPDLDLLTKIASVMMLISSIGAVHGTLFAANLDFKTPTIIQVICTLVTMPVVLICAINGLSFWSITIGGIVSAICHLTLLHKFSSWRPRFIYSWESFKTFFSFGSKLMLSNIINTGFNDVRAFIIGKFYSPKQLALYSRGNQLAYIIPSISDGIVGKLTMPILAKVNNDHDRLIKVFNKYVKLCTILPVWGVILFVSLAYPAIHLLYGENWSSCSVYAQMFALSFLLVHLPNLNAKLLIVKGYTNIDLKIQIFYKFTGTIMLCIAAPISVFAITVAFVINGVFAFILNLFVMKRVLKLSIRSQLASIGIYYVLALISVIPALILSYSNTGAIWLQLLIGVTCSTMIYWSVLWLRKDFCMLEILTIIRQKIASIRNKDSAST